MLALISLMAALCAILVILGRASDSASVVDPYAEGDLEALRAVDRLLDAQRDASTEMVEAVWGG